MVRQAAMRKFGLSLKNRKAPFKWADIVMFATAYGVLQQGYCHLVVSSMAVLMFGGMCRYSDASRLRWRNLQFDNDGNLDVTFDDHGGRKNSQFRQGATVTVSAIPHAEVCPVRLLRELQKLVESDQDSFVFRGFNGRLVAKSPGKTTPYVERIKYDQFLRYLSLWFSGVLGISSKDFRKQFGT
jgi:integrase